MTEPLNNSYNIIVFNFGRGLPLGWKDQKTTFQRILILINYSEWIKFSKFLNLKIPFIQLLLPTFSPPLFFALFHLFQFMGWGTRQAGLVRCED